MMIQISLGRHDIGRERKVHASLAPKRTTPSTSAYNKIHNELSATSMKYDAVYVTFPSIKHGLFDDEANAFTIREVLENSRKRRPSAGLISVSPSK